MKTKNKKKTRTILNEEYYTTPAELKAAMRKYKWGKLIGGKRHGYQG